MEDKLNGKSSPCGDDPLAEKYCVFLDFLRLKMVEHQLKARGIKDRRILDAMSKICRHAFVPEGMGARAYDDYEFPLCGGRTVQRPYMIALALQSLSLRGGEEVLELDAGYGYQTAVLSLLVKTVYAVESIDELRNEAEKKTAGYNIRNAFFLKSVPEKKFDAVISSGKFTDYDDKISGLLKTGGKLLSLSNDGNAFEIYVND